MNPISYHSTSTINSWPNFMCYHFLPPQIIIIIFSFTFWLTSTHFLYPLPRASGNYQSVLYWWAFFFCERKESLDFLRFKEFFVYCQPRTCPRAEFREISAGTLGKWGAAYGPGDGGRRGCAPQFGSPHLGLTVLRPAKRPCRPGGVVKHLGSGVVEAVTSAFLSGCGRSRHHRPQCFIFVNGTVRKRETALRRLWFGIQCVVALVTEQVGAAAWTPFPFSAPSLDLKSVGRLRWWPFRSSFGSMQVQEGSFLGSRLLEQGVCLQTNREERAGR